MGRISRNICCFFGKIITGKQIIKMYIFIKNFDKVSKFVYNNHKAVVRK